VISTEHQRRHHPSTGRPVKLMALVDGWAMVRCPGCIPFVVHKKDWLSWAPYSDGLPIVKSKRKVRL